MTRGTPTSKLLLASALLGFGCATATDLDAGDRVGSITAAVEIGASAQDVTGVRFDVLDAASACDGTVLTTETRALESESLPASLAGEDGANRPFADALFVLEPGPYRICATPLAGETRSSNRCAQAQMTVRVSEGQTSEVVLVSQCEGTGSGGLDVIVALNEPPRITAVTLDPSKFVTICESLAITVEAADPNDDAITYGWTLLAGPEGARLSADGAAATFSGAAGDYLVEITATDTRGNSSSLTFPIHVSDATCAVPQAVQAIFEASCSPCHIAGNSAGLRLATAETSHAALVARNAGAPACSSQVLVAPGEPAASYLIAKLRNTAGICGTAMPRNRPALPEEQIQLIEAWISALPN